MGVGLGRAPANHAGDGAGPIERDSATGRTRPRRSSVLRLMRRLDTGFEIREGDRGVAVMGRDAAFKRTLILADLLAALTALGLAAAAGGDALTPAAAALLPIFVLAGKSAGLYDRDEHVLAKGTLDEATSLFHVAT